MISEKNDQPDKGRIVEGRSTNVISEDSIVFAHVIRSMKMMRKNIYKSPKLILLKKGFFMINVIPLFLVVINLHAADIGSVLFVKGKVLVNKKVVSSAHILSEGDTIRTSKKSLAVLSLNDGTKIKLQENALIKLNQKNKVKPMTVVIDKGDAFFKVLKNKVVTSKNKFVVKNKFVSMGVRGTHFFVSSSTVKKEDLWMCVQEGLVAVKNKTDKKVVLVKAGEGIVSSRGKKTSSPKPLSWTKKLNWEMDPKKGDLTNNVSIKEAYTDLLDFDYD